MAKDFHKLFQTLSSIAFIILIFGSYVIVAQESFEGRWRADASDSAGKTDRQNKLQINFEKQTGRSGRFQNGASFDYAELQGLSREQALRGGAVSFRITREAGTIEFRGNFQDGRGAGDYRFTPSSQFASAMKSRGFDFERPSKYNNESEFESRYFLAMTLNITTAQADDLLSANFGNLDIDDLMKAAIFKIDSNYMRELKESGFPNLGMDELVKARIFKIDGEYLRELNAQGFGNEPFENVVKMKIFKIDPQFINEIRAEGFSNLDIEDLVKMRIFNINGAFIRQAKSEGVPLEVEKLVQKRTGFWKK